VAVVIEVVAVVMMIIIIVIIVAPTFHEAQIEHYKMSPRIVILFCFILFYDVCKGIRSQSYFQR
jgi:ABC-type nickel/cobalt efflux system permease component RcnA